MDYEMAEPLDIRFYAHHEKIHFCLEGKESHTGAGIQAFLADLPRDRTYTARFYGTADQAPYILAAAQSAYGSQTGQGRVAVGSPVVMRRTKNTPAGYALECMLQLHDYPQRRGGWRLLTQNDWRLFQFLANPNSETLQRHPAWPVLVALSTTRQAQTSVLIPDFPKDSPAIELLAGLEDVRWFHTLSEPDDCLAMLCMHLGCTSDHVGRWMNCKGKPRSGSLQHRLERLGSLLRLCFGPKILDDNGWLAPHLADGLAGDIFRTYHARSKSDGGEEDQLTALAATVRALVEFIHDGWLHETAPTGWELFVPKYFLEKHVRADLRAHRLAYLDVIRSSLPQRVGLQPLEGHKMWERS